MYCSDACGCISWFIVPFFCRIAWLCFAATHVFIIYIYTSSYSASVLPLPCNDPDALMVGLKRLPVTRRELISQSEYKQILLTCTPSTIYNPSFDLKYTEFFRSLALLTDIFIAFLRLDLICGIPSWSCVQTRARCTWSSPPPVRSASESRDLEGIRWALLLYSVIVKNPRPRVTVCGFYVSFPARRTWSALCICLFWGQIGMR